MRRALVLIALVFVLLAQRVNAQQVTVAWDPVADADGSAGPRYDVQGYHVYRTSPSAPQGEQIATTDRITTSSPVALVYDYLHTLWVTTFAAMWGTDDLGQTTVAVRESIPSATVTARIATPAPPPPPLSLTAPPDQTVITQTIPIVISYLAPTPVGGLPPYLTTCDPASGSSLGEGTVRVFCTTRDSAGQSANAAFLVTVVYAPPPPQPSGCLTAGTLAPIGARLNQTMKNGEADPFILARKAEGWVLLSRTKARNLTSVSMECRGK